MKAIDVDKAIRPAEDAIDGWLYYGSLQNVELTPFVIFDEITDFMLARAFRSLLGLDETD